jgi:hypothetical protein
MTPLPLEHQLLLQTLHALITGEPITQLPTVHWPTTLQLAAAHKLTPILHHTIPTPLIPAEPAAQLNQAARQQRMRTAVLIQDFQTIHTALVSAGIQAIPLKGIALAHTIYPSPTLRYFDDLDILVPAASAPVALATLQQLGYILHPNVTKPEWHHLPAHIHPQHGTTVEIHTDLIRRARPGWNLDEIWSRAQPGRIAGQDTLLLSTADALIYTALHARHNLFNRLSFFVDAALLARQLAETQGNSGELRGTKERLDLALLARQAGAQTALYHLLSTSQSLFSLPPSPNPLIPTTSSWLSQRIAGWQTLTPPQSNLRQGPIPHLLELLLMDSWADSLHMAGRILFPPADFVQEGYGSAGYGKRLLHRTGLATGQLLKLLRGK